MTGDEDFGGEGCRHRGRGRPRVPRTIGGDAGAFRCYGPLCRRGSSGGPEGSVTLFPEEIEIIRLVDLEGYDQESAATEMGVSRKTVWRDLHGARKKVADAIVNGKTICIEGCGRMEGGMCPKQPDDGDEE